jgi:hypothetical protein
MTRRVALAEARNRPRVVTARATGEPLTMISSRLKASFPPLEKKSRKKEKRSQRRKKAPRLKRCLLMLRRKKRKRD